MAIMSPINIGVRHVIVLSPLVAIAAAHGWVRWSESCDHRRPIVAVSAALIAAQMVLLVNPPPAAGWIAVSERVYRLNRVGRADPCSLTSGPTSQPIGWLDWLKPLEPVAIIGKTIRLYYVIEKDLPAKVVPQ